MITLSKEAKNFLLILLFFLCVTLIALHSVTKITGKVTAQSVKEEKIDWNFMYVFLFLISALVLVHLEEEKEVIIIPTAGERDINLQRARAGARAYLEHPGTKIIITGELTHGKYRGSENEAIMGVLDRAGVPREDRVLETKSHNTYENARNTARILEEMGATRGIIATDAYHFRRMGRLFTDLSREGSAPRNLSFRRAKGVTEHAYPEMGEIAAYEKDAHKETREMTLRDLGERVLEFFKFRR